MKRIGAVVCGALLFGLAGVAHGADDFQCYRIRLHKTNPKFVKTVATTSDSMNPAPFSTTFKRPFLLCDSASKNGSVIADSAARLSCFKIRGVIGAPQTQSVTDNFGTRTEVTRKKATVFCAAATSTP